MKFQLNIFGCQYKKIIYYPHPLFDNASADEQFDFAPVNYVRIKISFLALIMITLICRHELITFMVNVFSSNKSDIVVEVNTLNTIILGGFFFRLMKYFLKPRFRILQPHPCLWRKFHWSHHL